MFLEPFLYRASLDMGQPSINFTQEWPRVSCETKSQSWLPWVPESNLKTGFSRVIWTLSSTGALRRLSGEPTLPACWSFSFSVRQKQELLGSPQESVVGRGALTRKGLRELWHTTEVYHILLGECGASGWASNLLELETSVCCDEKYNTAPYHMLP